jgi:ABC-type amino acid transport substrate-binding protein
VFDELILKHIVKTDFPGRVRVLAHTFEHYYMSMALPPGSPLREPINRALLRVMATESWPRLIRRYVGPDG